jgi:hypothetical protein
MAALVVRDPLVPNGLDAVATMASSRCFIMPANKCGAFINIVAASFVTGQQCTV